MTLKPMNPEPKALWLAALESGEYKQGRGQLYDATNQQYCCLGVLCALFIKHGPTEAAWDLMDRGDKVEGGLYFGGGEPVNYLTLPPEVQDWAGLEGENPAVRITGGKTGLTQLNDSGATFERIAAAIKESL
jgi:hypothetical protein